ncbi:DUF4347 domain-containing protein [Planktothrix pseudagardhii]|nr:DUF4347 domain-containing protein [Planktothrix pseudagardhii]
MYSSTHLTQNNLGHFGLAFNPDSSTFKQTQEMIFIDSNVSDIDQLIAGVQPNTAVYVLHPQENGIAQITTILQQHAAIETVYLVAHGKPGCLYLGNTIFHQETLPTVSELLKTWNIRQLLIYACNVADGKTGEAFLQQLHHHTNAKIAASSHPIGQTEFGQNWQLNQTTHPIEIKSVFKPEVMATYSGVLAAGDLDTTFSGDGIVTTDLGSGTEDNGSVMTLQPDGKIIVAGTSNDDIALVRYNSNGSLDTTFSGDGKLTTDLGGEEFGNSMVLQPDGKIVVVGRLGYPNFNFDIAVVRYNSNGSLDTTFSGDGKLTTDLGGYESGESVALQSDGKIIVGGSNQLLRYNSNGTLDTTFGENGIKTFPVNWEVDGYNGISIAVQADGKIVVAGGIFDAVLENFVVARLNSNGSLDTTFSDDGIVTTDLGDEFEWSSGLVLQPDGKIVLAGNTGDGTFRHPADFAVVRYNSNGSLDTTFSGDGKVTTDLGSWYDFGQSVELQPDGKIVVAGDSDSNFAVVRYNSNGSLDTTLSGDGKLTTDLGGSEYGGSVALQSDGKIVLAGSSSNDFAVVRYLNDTASGTINGTANNDILTGTANPEIINGLGGNDQLLGNGGNDTLNGGDGIDTLDGGAGNDLLKGNAGNDIYIVGTGDVLTELANEGTDLVQSSISYTLPVNVENLTLTGTTAINGTGNTVANIITGNTANNILNGSTGADQLKGGTGNDTYVVDNAGDIVTELASGGTDLVQSSVTYTLPVEVENLTLTGTTAINGTGNALANIITGNTANNILNGSTGADQLKGSTGNDTYVVDNALDVVTELASGGTDLIQSSVTYTLPVEVENLTLTGTTAINGTGNTLVNIITGNTANNILNGSTGADQLKGSTGNDTYVVDNALDVVTELASGGTDLVQSSVTYTLPVEVENLTLTGTTAINGTGNALANIITGNTANNILNGSTGNDNLIGSSGADQLLGGDGNDSLSGDAANDTLTGGLGADKFIYNTNAAFTTTAVGLDSITDFTIAQGDLIVLDKTTFTSISSIAGTGFSVATEFAKVTTDALAATSAADIVYNTATGGLFYNQNGTAAGFGTGAQFLTLTTKPVLTATQFVIQA